MMFEAVEPEGERGDDRLPGGWRLGKDLVNGRSVAVEDQDSASAVGPDPEVAGIFADFAYVCLVRVRIRFRCR